MTPEQVQKQKQGQKNHAFNQYASDLISVRRSLPDKRLAEYGSHHIFV